MKKLLLLSVLLISMVLPAQSPKQDTTKKKKEVIPQKESTVIICNGKSSYAYHKYYCKGLKKCKSGTKTVTEKQAKDMGRTPCGYCYKK